MSTSCEYCGQPVALRRWSARGHIRWSVPGILSARLAVTCQKSPSGLHAAGFTDQSAAHERSHGSDPALWDAAGEFERLRAQGMTAAQANAFMRHGELS